MSAGVAGYVLVGALALGLLSVVPVVTVVLPPARVLLGAYAFVLPSGSAYELPGIPPPFNSLSSLVGLVVAILLGLHVLRGRQARDWPPGALALLLLAGWLGLTVLWSVNPNRSIARYLLLLSLAGLYAVATLVPWKRRDLRWMEVGVVAGAVLLCLQALTLAASGSLQPGEGGRLPRFAVDTGDPNITAASLLLPWVLCAWTALNSTRRRWRWLGLVAATVIFAGIVLTGSRGGLLALGVGFLAIVIRSSGAGRWRSMPYLGATFLAGSMVLAAAPMELQNHLRGTTSTGRAQIWGAALGSCTDGCWLGSGWGTFVDVYRNTYLSDLSVAGLGDKNWASHNVAIGLLVEGGIVGLALLIAAFVLLTRDLTRLERAVAGPAVAGLAALVAANMLVSNLTFKYFWFTLLYATVVITTYREPVRASSAQQAAERPAARAPG